MSLPFRCLHAVIGQLLILLAATVIAAAYGILASIAGTSWQSASWWAAKTPASVAAACHTVLAPVPEELNHRMGPVSSALDTGPDRHSN
ncbi:hypothetical protein [Streptomyces sp. NPDC094149]|uniref:hypothetical protein n=1 Tax=Streptomyces sp. NPDC094149 TaxID=3155079 RepID=UPI00331B250B